MIRIVMFRDWIFAPGKKYVVVFDFPGKDSIQYYNEVPVDELVFNNLRLFCDGKKRTDELFDKLNVSM